MKSTGAEEPFYVGYWPKAPEATTHFVRRAVGVLGVGALLSAALMAVALPYFGAGEFEFGRPRNFPGTLRCETAAPRLNSSDDDFLLVGYGKHGVPPEICGATDRDVVIRGSLIRREGRQLIEVEHVRESHATVEPALKLVALGRFTLTGEIVDSKCYFGVMNPGEGRLHRACAELCLRGGVPAVLVVRDRAGDAVHVIIADGSEKQMNEALLPWIGQMIEVSGEVTREGRWLRLHPDLASLRLALR